MRKLSTVVKALAGGAVVASAIMVALASDLRPAGSPGDRLRPALSALDRGDYATAHLLLKPMAKQGLPRAQLLLGVMYLRGEGVPRDALRGRRLVAMAAWRGVEAAKQLRDRPARRYTLPQLAQQMGSLHR